VQTRPETSKAQSKVIEAQRSKSFDNDVFFYIEAKRTHSIIRNLFRTEANMFILKNSKIEAKQTRWIVVKFIWKRSKYVYIKEFKNQSEANTFDI
jgi:hypothetical protein